MWHVIIAVALLVSQVTPVSAAPLFAGLAITFGQLFDHAATNASDPSWGWIPAVATGTAITVAYLRGWDTKWKHKRDQLKNAGINAEALAQLTTLLDRATAQIDAAATVVDSKDRKVKTLDSEVATKNAKVKSLTDEVSQLQADLARAQKAPAGPSNDQDKANLAAALRNVKGRLRDLDDKNAQVDALLSLLDQLIKAASNNEDIPDIPFRPEDDEVLSPPQAPDIFEHLGSQTRPHASLQNRSMDWEPTPHQFPGAPRPDETRDSFIQVDPPFLYDGTPTQWREWKMTCLMYFGAERKRFRDRAEILYIMLNRLKQGSRPQRFLQTLAAHCMTQGHPHEAEFNALVGAYSCAQWILAALKPHCTSLEYDAKTRAALYKPQGTHRYDHWIQDVRDAMDYLDIPVGQALPVVIQGISDELKLEFSLAWSKTPEMFNWEDLTINGPVISNMVFRRNKEHHAHFENRRTKSHPGHAATPVASRFVAPSVPGNSPVAAPFEGCKKKFDDAPSVPAWLRKKFAEDARLRPHCVQHGLCFRCRRPASDHTGHKSPHSGAAFPQQPPPARAASTASDAFTEPPAQ